ncbi:hypothetical protein ACHAXT_012833 [Thalassiosira profunda]
MALPYAPTGGRRADKAMHRQLTTQSSCTQASFHRASVEASGTAVVPKGLQETPAGGGIHKLPTGSTGMMSSDSASHRGESETFEISVVEEAEVLTATEAEVRSLAARNAEGQLDMDEKRQSHGASNATPTPAPKAPSAAPAAFSQIQPILINTPPNAPLGIDIDMVMPVVSYVQPSSPLRGHVAVGDILVFIDGKSTAELSHGALTRMLNGNPHGNVSNDGRRVVGREAERVVDAKRRKLIFLPGKYGRKLGIKPVATAGETDPAKGGKDIGSTSGSADGNGSSEAASSRENESVPAVEKESVDRPDVVAVTPEGSEDGEVEPSEMVDVAKQEASAPAAPKAVSPSGTDATMDTKGTGSQSDSRDSLDGCVRVLGDATSTPKQKVVAAADQTDRTAGENAGAREVEANRAELLPALTTDITAKMKSSQPSTPLSSRSSSLKRRNPSEQQTFATCQTDTGQTVGQTFHTCQSHSTPEGTGADRSSKPSRSSSHGEPSAANVRNETLDSPPSTPGVDGTDQNEEMKPQQREVNEEPIVGQNSGYPVAEQPPEVKSTAEGQPNGPNSDPGVGSSTPENAKIDASVPQEKRQSSATPTPPPDLNEEDLRRWERRNRPAPTVDYVDVPYGDASHSPKDRGEDVSTIYGGRWDPALHDMAGRRVEDALGYAEEGYGVASVLGGGGSVATGRSTVLKYDPNSFSQLRMLGLAGPDERRRERDARQRRLEREGLGKEGKEEDSRRMKRQQRCVEVSLATLIGLSVVALVVILVLVLRGR